MIPFGRSILTRMAAPFGAYAIAFAILFSAIAIELVGAVLVGARYLGLEAGQVLRVSDIGLGATGWFLIPLGWLGLIAIALTRRKSAHPTRTLLRIVRRQRHWLIRGVALTLLHIPIGRAFATYKASIPFVNQFEWDQRFADFERAIFSVDTWRLTHAVIGDGGTVAIDRIYALWGTYLILLAGWIGFTRNRDIQIKAAIAFNLTWFGLGSALATYFASVGPCFYERYYGSDRFAPLMAILAKADSDHSLLAFKAMEYLSANSGTGALGTGISAMPSLHVATATLGVVIAFATGARPWVKTLAIVFAATIMLGSVHLGWHYAIDGIVSAPLTVAIWFASSWMVDATRRVGTRRQEGESGRGLSYA